MVQPALPKKKFTPEEVKKHIISTKKQADLKWDLLVQRINDGEKVNRDEIITCMDDCNRAEWGCYNKGILRDV